MSQGVVVSEDGDIVAEFNVPSPPTGPVVIADFDNDGSVSAPHPSAGHRLRRAAPRRALSPPAAAQLERRDHADAHGVHRARRAADEAPQATDDGRRRPAAAPRSGAPVARPQRRRSPRARRPGAATQGQEAGPGHGLVRADTPAEAGARAQSVPTKARAVPATAERPAPAARLLSPPAPTASRAPAASSRAGLAHPGRRAPAAPAPPPPHPAAPPHAAQYTPRRSAPGSLWPHQPAGSAACAARLTSARAGAADSAARTGARRAQARRDTHLSSAPFSTASCSTVLSEDISRSRCGGATPSAPASRAVGRGGCTERAHPGETVTEGFARCAVAGGWAGGQRALTASRWSFLRAASEGSCPALSLVETAAPNSSRISMAERSPSLAAWCSGVHPSLSRASMSILDD